MFTYDLRGIALSLAMFVLSYVLLKSMVALGWWIVERRYSAAMCNLSPNFLYGLQVGPFLASVVVVVLFAVPSFVRFEPHSASEEFGPPVVVLSTICLMLLIAGLTRAHLAVSRTARTVRKWKPQAFALQGSKLPILQTGPDAPPLVVAGILRPKMLMSSSTSALLSQEELTRAIEHEAAHIRQHDNLKKLALRILSFPSLSRLEKRWLAALEIAADQSAVSNRREALDLASALVKSSRVSVPTPELVTNLASPSGALLQARIERLLAWESTGNSVSSRYLARLAAATTVFAVLTILRYDLLLSLTHRFTELLMR